MSQPLVKNAADESQVRGADKKQKNRHLRDIVDLKEILSLPAGRRVIWRLLVKCKTFETVWHPSALIHYNAGQQDLGHFILGEVMEAKPEAYLQMSAESKKEDEAQDDVDGDNKTNSKENSNA